MIIHFGSVWPLFTEWATLGEYRYHRPVPAYSNLRSNSLLALDGALGHVTEVLSGDYYQALSTSSPHQIWSSAMVVSSLLRGLLGLETDATSHQLTFAPVQFRDDGCLTSTDGKSAATDMIQKLPLTGLIAALSCCRACCMYPRASLTAIPRRPMPQGTWASQLARNAMPQSMSPTHGFNHPLAGDFRGLLPGGFAFALQGRLVHGRTSSYGHR